MKFRLSIFHPVYLFCMLGGLFPMLVNGPSDFRDFAGDRSQATNVIYLAVHIPYLLAFMMNPGRYIGALRLLKLPAALTVLAVLSALWSDYAIRTLAIGTFLSLQLVAVLVIARSSSYDEMFRMVVLACFLSTALSLIFIALIPSFGTMTYVFPGAWQGIFIHKNVLGRFAVLSTSVFLVYWIRERSAFGLIGLAASLLLAVGSASATALVGTAILFAVLLVIRSRRWAGLLSIVTLMGLGSLYVLSSNLLSTGLALLGKSETLTGRTTIWSLVIEAISFKPFLGYGMGGFWESAQAQTLRTYADWLVPHAHNGILEVALQLGWLGAGLLLLVLVQTAYAAKRLYDDDSYRYRLWPILFVATAIVYGIGEANYMRPNSFVQLFMYLIIIYGAGSTQDNRAHIQEAAT